MRSVAFLLLLFCVCNVSGATRRLKTVMLMLENRSFLHMLGVLDEGAKKAFSYTNRVNSSDPQSPLVHMTRNPPYVLHCDPDHSLPATTAKIFGMHDEKQFGPGFTGKPAMDGFVEWEHTQLKRNDSCLVMSAYTPDMLPVTTFLAKEFSYFRNYHCSVPGPTWPNRLFALSATAMGLTETGPWYKNQLGLLFPQESIFEQLERHGFSSRLYYSDSPWETFMRSVLYSKDLRPFAQFLADAKSGSLPDFSWIWPRAAVDVVSGLGANDDHPDHDIALGEALMKQVYDALRSSPDWENVVLMITMDEHGGFYDNVHPPQNIPSPEPHPASYPDKGFQWTRLGIRVPLIVVSPLIPKGTVVGEPPAAQKPAHNSAYDHTSMMSTMRKFLGINESLTARDAWAATFEHIFSLSTPRDTPLTAPNAPPPTRSVHHEAESAVNDLQRTFLEVHTHLGSGHKHVSQQKHLQFEASYKRIAHKSRMLLNSFKLYFAPEQNRVKIPNLITDAWDISSNSTQIKTVHVVKEAGVHICITVRTPGSPATAEPCRPNFAPQTLIFQSDFTIRPQNGSSLCLTVLPAIGTPNSKVFGQRPATLSPCNESVEQHFAYSGHAPGNDFSGNLFFGTGYLGLYSS